MCAQPLNRKSTYYSLNDLNLAIKYCKVHHFPDDTNLLNNNISLKTKYINYHNVDLKNLTNLNAHKISLSMSKTELVILNRSIIWTLT